MNRFHVSNESALNKRHTCDQLTDSARSGRRRRHAAPMSRPSLPCAIIAALKTPELHACTCLKLVSGELWSRASSNRSSTPPA